MFVYVQHQRFLNSHFGPYLCTKTNMVIVRERLLFWQTYNLLWSRSWRSDAQHATPWLSASPLEEGHSTSCVGTELCRSLFKTIRIMINSVSGRTHLQELQLWFILGKAQTLVFDTRVALPCRNLRYSTYLGFSHQWSRVNDRTDLQRRQQSKRLNHLDCYHLRVAGSTT